LIKQREEFILDLARFHFHSTTHLFHFKTTTTKFGFILVTC